MSYRVVTNGTLYRIQKRSWPWRRWEWVMLILEDGSSRPIEEGSPGWARHRMKQIRGERWRRTWL